MKFRIAQLNIARFEMPQEHPSNSDFINSLDRVNEIAESQPGFVWRFTGDGNNALDVQAFDDPDIAVNMSVWTDLDALGAFVYRNEEHLALMRRRREWFDNIKFHLVLWWIEEGHIPTLDEAKRRLETLVKHGPSNDAFTFREPYPPPGANLIEPILDVCA
jgi:hypothetical protein